jgi:8-oxo-dGTP pyrophosphatase MutT (NUDIX family)
MSPSNTQKKLPKSVAPTFGHYAAEDFVQGGGVAIFHIASKRVVVCSAVDRRLGKYYFLPKGRRDAGEDAKTGAEREGFEEVCIPHLHINAS